MSDFCIYNVPNSGLIISLTHASVEKIKKQCKISNSSSITFIHMFVLGICIRSNLTSMSMNVSTLP